MAIKKEIVVGDNEVNLVSKDLEEKATQIKNEGGNNTIVVDTNTESGAEEITIVKPAESKPVEKRVKVLMKESHKCCIGGEWYHLLKGKQYNVPENVKEVLVQADKLLPL